MLALTDAQKQNIQMLRGQGFPFSRIAQEVGLSVNTVKSFCRRAGEPVGSVSEASEIKENKEKSTEIKDSKQRLCCKCCGKSLQHLPKAKPKQFCNDACRAKWWNTHRAEMHRQAMVPATCASCGAMFMRYAKTGRKYCSHACYVQDRFG
ncbi:RNA polymerase subunit sigma-70 [Eubacteriales bacterium OttesenSCG-928-A19]|nr:RNA polymerase subunit sigma-70 [Eubacteriales bacterium OttesenSCG-928-A19]